jgi:hypothetical protein
MFEQERKAIVGLAMVVIIAIILPLGIQRRLQARSRDGKAIPRDGMRGSLAGLLANQSKL